MFIIISLYFLVQTVSFKGFFRGFDLCLSWSGFYQCILGISVAQTFLLWFWSSLKDVMKQKLQQIFWSMPFTSSVTVYENVLRNIRPDLVLWHGYWFGFRDLGIIPENECELAVKNE